MVVVLALSVHANSAPVKPVNCACKLRAVQPAARYAHTSIPAVAVASAPWLVRAYRGRISTPAVMCCYTHG
jgi:hypothetical protein